MGYSTTSRTYRVFNPDKNKVEESINITFNESNIDLVREEEVFADSDSVPQMRQTLSKKGQKHSGNGQTHSEKGLSHSERNCLILKQNMKLQSSIHQFLNQLQDL